MAKGAKEQRKKAVNTRGILILVLISLLVVPLVYWIIGWRAGFVLLLLIPWIAYWRFIPSKFFRAFLYAYLIYAIAFISATWLQMQLAQNPRLIAFIDDHRLVSFFLGGEHGFAKQVLFAIVVGVLLGLLAVNIPLLAIVFVSSEWVLALHQTAGVDRRSAIGYVRSLILGMQYPSMIVDEGKVIQSKPEGVLPQIGGPGLAVIRPGHAVVFERAGKITQVAAPGLIRLERFERIQDIVQLKPMWHSDSLENVLTKDRIPLRITFGVGFQIEPKSEVHKRTPDGEPSDPVTSTPVLSDDAYMVYEGSIRKAVFDTASDWKATTFGFAENLLRDIVATYDFDQIFKRRPTPGTKDEEVTFDPDDRTIREIEIRVLTTHQETAPSWGVHTRSVDIKIIELPDEAQEQMLEVWAARHESEEDLIKARSRGETLLIEARAGREAATQRASARIIEARATRDAIIERGYAEAEAYAEQFRRVLSSVPDQYIGIIIEQLAGRIGLDDMMQFLNAITGNRRLLGARGRLAEPGTASPSEESAPPEDTEG